MEINIVISSA